MLTVIAQEWDEPLFIPPVSEKEVHVWQADLDRHSSLAELQTTLLSHDEIARAKRYKFPQDSMRYSVGRSICRLMLSRYLNIQAKDLVFQYNRYDRPYISSSLNYDNFNFNISHSENRFLLAVSKERDIGIDIEKVRCNFDCLEIAKGFFSTSEIALLETLPPAERELGFITCWTQKEAYIKAQGMGLSLDFDSFDVSLDPKRPAKLLSVQNDPSQVSKWKLHTFPPFDGYVSTIAVEGQDWQARFYDPKRVLDRFA